MQIEAVPGYFLFPRSASLPLLSAILCLFPLYQKRPDFSVPPALAIVLPLLPADDSPASPLFQTPLPSSSVLPEPAPDTVSPVLWSALPLPAPGYREMDASGNHRPDTDFRESVFPLPEFLPAHQKNGSEFPETADSLSDTALLLFHNTFAAPQVSLFPEYILFPVFQAALHLSSGSHRFPVLTSIVLPELLPVLSLPELLSTVPFLSSVLPVALKEALPFLPVLCSVSDSSSLSFDSPKVLPEASMLVVPVPLFWQMYLPHSAIGSCFLSAAALPAPDSLLIPAAVVVVFPYFFRSFPYALMLLHTVPRHFLFPRP